MAKGSNSSRLRKYNVRVLLTAMRRADVISKAELARYSNLTPQAVTRIVDELEQSNLIIRQGRRFGVQGQPSTLYSIDPTGAYSIGIKVGRHNMQLVLMDFGGAVLDRITHEYDYPEAQYLLSKLAGGITSLTGKLPSVMRERITGIGIAMPWFIGAWQEKTGMSKVEVKRWEEMNFPQEVMKLTDLPVFFENDCSAAAIAELQFGNGKLANNFLYILVGTFVGGGLVLNGALESGIHGNAGALASMPVPRSELYGGNEAIHEFDFLLNRASIFVLMEYLTAHGVVIDNLNQIKDLTNHKQAKPLIKAWLHDCADALAYAILSSVSVLDLEIVIIDAFLPKLLVNELVNLVNRRILKISPAEVFVPNIVEGSMGYDAVALGGAMLPFYSAFAPDKTVLLKGIVPNRVSVEEMETVSNGVIDRE